MRKEGLRAGVMAGAVFLGLGGEVGRLWPVWARVFWSGRGWDCAAAL
ncbi:MAG: hypothetical protein ACX938_06740 [Roseivivax sp.]